MNIPQLLYANNYINLTYSFVYSIIDAFDTDIDCSFKKQ